MLLASWWLLQTRQANGTGPAGVNSLLQNRMFLRVAGFLACLGFSRAGLLTLPLGFV
jgi:hypothetical protein